MRHRLVWTGSFTGRLWGFSGWNFGKRRRQGIQKLFGDETRLRFQVAKKLGWLKLGE